MDSDASSPQPPAGWHISAEGIAYPPEPWRLRGILRASLWLVPEQRVAALLPKGIKPMIVDGEALAVTGWAVYTPGGVLEYQEFLCAIVTGSKEGLGLTVTHIWVDSPASMAGGRELWGIPKQLARFGSLRTDGFGEEVRDDKGPIASLTFDPVASLPGRWPILAQTVQEREGAIKLTRLNATGEVGFGHAAWSFSETGPLAFLHGLRPVLSMRLGSAALSFGV